MTRATATRSFYRLDAEFLSPVLASVLAKLSPADRDTLLLHAFADLTYEQIAHATDVPIGKRCLGDAYDTQDDADVVPTSTPRSRPSAWRCRSGGRHPQPRARNLFELRDRLLACAEEMAQMVMLEMGRRSPTPEQRLHAQSK